jgi:hypothetical protein
VASRDFVGSGEVYQVVDGSDELDREVDGLTLSLSVEVRRRLCESRGERKRELDRGRRSNGLYSG